MKKRLLALILCLVMVVSLLPITAAAAAYNLTSVTIQASGVEWGFDGYSDGYNLSITNWIFHDWYSDSLIDKNTFQGSFQGGSLFTDSSRFDRLTVPPEEGGVYYTQFYMTESLTSFDHDPNFFAKLEIPGYKTECYQYQFGSSYLILDFRLTKEAHEHTWQFSFTENSLTANCPNCTIGPVSVTITASSVTLPNSPFNATVEVSENFNEAFHRAYISPIRYDYEDSEGVWHYDIDPIPANAKAGRYQAGVSVSGFSGNDEVAAGAFSTDDGTNPGGRSVYLFVKYTAADPAITAQTGDNRPIELMMAGVAVFSVLAAAAFILDSKRKYSR